MNITRNIVNDDGSVDTIMISSDDNYQVKVGKYVLANHNVSKLERAFKKSILGMDMGVNRSGFVSMAIISSLLAVATLVIMYFSFRI